MTALDRRAFATPFWNSGEVRGDCAWWRRGSCRAAHRIVAQSRATRHHQGRAERRAGLIDRLLNAANKHGEAAKGLEGRVSGTDSTPRPGNRISAIAECEVA